jgi:hypothetical protein
VAFSELCGTIVYDLMRAVTSYDPGPQLFSSSTLLASFVCALFFVVNMNADIEKMNKTAENLRNLLIQHQYRDVPEKGTAAYQQEEQRHAVVVCGLLKEHLTSENVNTFGR